MIGTIKSVAKVVSLGLTVKSGYDFYKKGKTIYNAYSITKKTNNFFKKNKNDLKEKVKKLIEEDKN